MPKKIAIIGAGLSGLACAVELKRNKIQATVFESHDRVGGRVKTDQVDGFLLDHGFQVFLPSYKMGSYFLDYNNLNLKTFSPGAYILKQGNLNLISDPLREPSRAISTAFSSLATFKDKLLTMKLLFSKKTQYESIQTTLTALEYLKSFGFSDNYINNFFIPFFSGVFLTKSLDVPADYFKFLFKCFSQSYACLPNEGMAQIPMQMANEIGMENIKLNSPTDAKKLLSEGYDHVFVSHPSEQNKKPEVKFYGVKTEYYKTQSTRWASRTLYLNANKNSAVNHIACLTAVNSNYAPKGWHLYSVNTIGDLEKDSRQDLINFFGPEEVNTWELIKTYKIKRALPRDTSFGSYLTSKQANTSFCGDYLESPSIQGALYSGRKVAREYLNEQCR